MKNLKRVTPAALATAIGTSAPAFAHHSHAMFDYTRETTVTGTVKEFVFRNPHVYLYVQVKNDRGDMVTVTVHPLRDGRPGGDYATLTTGDGRTFDRDSDAQ